MKYGRGLHRQLNNRVVISVVGLKPEEVGRLVGWIVGWPVAEPTLYGRITSRHGKNYLSAHFKHGLPGEALTEQVVIIREMPKHEVAAPKIEKSLSIVDIEGIGPKYAEKLAAEKIHTVADLLDSCKTPEMRKELAEKIDVSPKFLLDWVNMADLFRIKGVGEEYADLLEEAGVDTVKELATRNAEHLQAKMVEVNESKKLVKKLPSLSAVETWVKEAKALPRKVDY